MIVPPDIEQLVRRIAARSGRTPKDVIRDGVTLEARIAGVDINAGSKARAVDMNRVRVITRRVSRQPLRDPRGARDIRDQAWGMNTGRITE